MNKPLHCFFLFLFSFTSYISAQDVKKVIADKDNSVQDVMNYWESINGNEDSPGYKTYQRWLYKNQFKYGETGNRNIDYTPVFQTYNSLENNTPIDMHQWIERGPLTAHSDLTNSGGGMGRIDHFYVNPMDEGHIYLATNGGSFWRTTDGGQSWQGSTTDPLFSGRLRAIGVAPSNPDKVYIKVQNSYANNIYVEHGILVSDDGGITWQTTKATNIFNEGTVEDFLTIDPENEDIVYYNDGLKAYKTEDGFATVSELDPLSDYLIYDLQFAPDDSHKIYVTTSDSLLMSSNKGASFESIASISSGPFTDNRKVIEIPSTRPNEVFVRMDEQIHKSDNYGVGMSLLYDTEGDFIWGFVPSETDENILFLGGVSLYRSVDGGAAFDLTNATSEIHVDIRKMEYVNGTLYVATDGYLAKSSDEGITWTILTEVLNIRENYAVNASQQDAEMYIAGAQDNGTELQKGDKLYKISGSDGMTGIIHPLNRNLIVSAVQRGGRYVSFDGGKSSINLLQFGTPGVWNSPLIYSKGDFLQQYAFLGGKIFKSDLFGLNESLIFDEEIDIYEATYAFNNPQSFAFAASSTPFSLDSTFVYISENAGNTFRKSTHNLPLAGAASDMAFSPNNDSVLIVTYGVLNEDKTILLSNDFGYTWTNITYNLENIPINAVAIDHAAESNIYVGTELGVFTKKMEETSWSLYSNGLPIVEIQDLDIQYGSNQLYAATYGRGVWSTNLKGKENYPEIQQVDLSVPPDLNHPRLDQNVRLSAIIESENAIESAYILYGVNSTQLANTISLSNINDNIFEANDVFPHNNVGDKIYFMVVVEDDQNHTSTSIRYMYSIKKDDYCDHYIQGFDLGPFTYIETFNLNDLNLTKNEGIGFANISNEYSLTLTEGEAYQVESTTSSIIGGASVELLLAFDWNNDLVFDLDTETYYLGSNPPNTTGATSNSPFLLNVPQNIQSDTVRMRLFLLNKDDASYELLTSNLCQTALYSEILDLDVVIGHVTSTDNPFLTKNQPLIFPNPSDDFIKVTGLNEMETFDIKIIGQDGKTYIIQKNQHGKELRIDTSKLSAGVYSLEIKSSDAKWSGKFIKSK